MRRLVLAATIAVAMLGATPARAQAPGVITVDRIDCSPLGPGEHIGSAILRCVDEQDGLELDYHDLGGEQWLTLLVYP